MSTPPVVGIPGTLCTPGMFRPLAHELRGRARLAAYDWMTGPGPWDIPAVAGRLLATVRRRTGGAPVVLAGHSTGGAIALQAAIRDAEREDPLVTGVLVMNSGANTAGHGDIDALIDTFRADKLRGWRAVGGRRSFATPPGPAMRARMEAYARRVPVEAVIDVLSSQRDLDLAPRLGRIACPVTVLHGTRDRARTPDHARAIADGATFGEVHWTFTGHTPHVENPPAAAGALFSLLSRL